MQPIGRRKWQLSDYVKSDLEIYLSEIDISRKDKKKIISLAENIIKKKFDNRLFFNDSYGLKVAYDATIEVADIEIEKIKNRKMKNLIL